MENTETKIAYPKSRRFGRSYLSGYGTPLWHVYGEDGSGVPLGMTCRGPDGRTWEAKGTHHVTDLASKAAAEDEIRRQWCQWRAEQQSQANVINLASHRRSYDERP